jgi:hypothetical protein
MTDLPVSLAAAQRDQMSFWKHCPKCSPTHFFAKIITKILPLKILAKNWATSVIYKKLQKINNRPVHENSPNLVALGSSSVYCVAVCCRNVNAKSANKLSVEEEEEIRNKRHVQVFRLLAQQSKSVRRSSVQWNFNFNSLVSLHVLTSKTLRIYICTSGRPDEFAKKWDEIQSNPFFIKSRT